MAECAAAIRPLGSRPDSINFANGGGYRQHTPAAVVSAKSALLMILRREAKYITLPDDGRDISALGFASRIASECAAPLSRAWYRLDCIDHRGREWGQPYFAINPDNGEQREISSPVPTDA